MKRIFSAVLVFAMLLSLCGCGRTSLGKNAAVTLTFIYLDEDIRVTLHEDEAKRVKDILDGKIYDPFGGIPSCGFDKDISLKVGNRVFAIARDTCGCVQDLGNLRFFSLSQEDIDYIHALFEKYGGRFPCI